MISPQKIYQFIHETKIKNAIYFSPIGFMLAITSIVPGFKDTIAFSYINSISEETISTHIIMSLFVYYLLLFTAGGLSSTGEKYFYHIKSVQLGINGLLFPPIGVLTGALVALTPLHFIYPDECKVLIDSGIKVLTFLILFSFGLSLCSCGYNKYIKLAKELKIGMFLAVLISLTLTFIT